MRVVATEGSLVKDWVPRLCLHRGQPYAILSHCWLSEPNEEVVYADIEEIDRPPYRYLPASARGTIKNPHYIGSTPITKPGFAKLKGAVQRANKDGFLYIWVDTCCIDKDSSSELSEAINSMWLWYKGAEVCYVYLADVDKAGDDPGIELEFSKSRWWTRGWTLQELLAPRDLVFFSRSWNTLGQKGYMDMVISDITGIDPNIINGSLKLATPSVAQRMSWMASRKTTRIEDIAYCLMGLFGVNMPLLYGEGRSAFLRLQLEIMKQSDDETIFAWGDQRTPWSYYSGMLAEHPSAFASSRHVVPYHDTSYRTPYSMTNKGLHITFDLFDKHAGRVEAYLRCRDDQGQVVLYLERLSTGSEQYARDRRIIRSPVAPAENLQRRSIYVHQFNKTMKTSYTRLGSDSDVTKTPLFRLLPTDDRSPIQARLVICDLRIAQYTAISYLRNAKGPKQEILVDGQPQYVRSEAYGFLQKANRECRRDLFWIDDVCFKERDDPHEAKRITEINEVLIHADQVIVWLGQKDTDSALSQVLKPRGGYRDFDALETVAKNSFWKQGRITQEILLNNNLNIETQTHKLDLQKLQKEHRHMISFYGLRCPRPSMKQLSDLLFILQIGLKIESPSCRNQWRCRTEIQVPTFKFRDLLQAARYLVFSDIEAKIRTLASLAGMAELVSVVDEELPPHLFIRAVKCLGPKFDLSDVRLLLHGTNEGVEDIYNDAIRPCESKSYEPQVYTLEVSEYQYLSHVGPGQRLTPTDGSLPTHPTRDTYIALVLEEQEHTMGGILLSRIQNNPHWRPCKLYKKVQSGTELHPLPTRLEQAFVNTTAALKKLPNSGPMVVMGTDHVGLLALSFCVQWPDRSLPPVFDLAQSKENYESTTDDSMAE